jgi:hypothetical protein
VPELLELLPAEDRATLHLTMRVASPFIHEFIRRAAQHRNFPATARGR